MPHTRVRYLSSSLTKVLGASPLVGILGHRQVGKSTLLEQHAARYFTLDDSVILSRATDEPAGFLKEAALSRGAVAIDEAQFAPPLFPALKEFVRTSRRPGQFLLSGSVRFTSRKAIRESLTGRILNLELLPFSVAELMGRELPDTVRQSVEADDFSRNPFFASELSAAQRRSLLPQAERYLAHGGLPGICFIRDESLREKKILDQLATILDRDLRLVVATSLSFREILRFVEELALMEGQPISHSELRRKTGITPPTQKKLIYALESLFVIRLLPVEGTRKGMVVYFEDQGEHRALTRGRFTKIEQISALLYRNIRLEWAYRLRNGHRVFHYLTRGGARVPLAIESAGKTLGIIPVLDPDGMRSAMASAASFLSAYSQSKVIIAAVDEGITTRVETPRIWVTSYSRLLV